MALKGRDVYVNMIGFLHVVVSQSLRWGTRVHDLDVSNRISALACLLSSHESAIHHCNT